MQSVNQPMSEIRKQRSKEIVMSATAVLPEVTCVMKPAMAKIASKFQVTVPPEVRNLYGLQEGDLLEWKFDQDSRVLIVEPKRATLLSPVVDSTIAAARKRRSEQRQKTQENVKAGGV